MLLEKTPISGSQKGGTDLGRKYGGAVEKFE